MTKLCWGSNFYFLLKQNFFQFYFFHWLDVTVVVVVVDTTDHFNRINENMQKIDEKVKISQRLTYESDHCNHKFVDFYITKPLI